MKTVWLQMEGKTHRVELRAADGGDEPEGQLACRIDGVALEVDARWISPGVVSLIAGGRQYRCRLDGESVVVDGERYGFGLGDPRSLQTRAQSANEQEGVRAVKAPMPGRVLRVLVRVGDAVVADQGLVVIEAMKMQNELRSPKAGVVQHVAALEGDSVQSGDLLVLVE